MDLKNILTRPLVVVTNREPYVDEKTSKGIRTIQKAGGVVSAIDPLLQSLGGDWIAWGSGSADQQTAENGVRQVPPKDPRYRLHRVYLTPEEVQGYYNHYANQGLWPLSHSLIERARFSRRAWQIYRSVNQKFAEKATAISRQNAWLFSHDYQLALVPQFVRQARRDVAIIHFWHIPWPSYTIFRLCPQYQEILTGLLGADIIGFQTEDDVQAFLTAVEQTFNSSANHRQGTITWQGRIVHVKAFPISVDFQDIDQLVQTERIDRWHRSIRRRLAKTHRILGVSVDRADYTKGILPRLAAMREFFLRYPEYRDSVSLLQVVVPTRSEVKEYRSFYRQVEEETLRINREFGTATWQPVMTLRRNVDRPRLMGLFRAADFALVSSLFDGMNLVAKEYVAAQVDLRGVLLLSEAAGASNELAQAFAINPLDTEGFAATLNEALKIPAAERAARMDAMRRHIAQHTIYDWLESILITLKDITETYASK